MKLICRSALPAFTASTLLLLGATSPAAPGTAPPAAPMIMTGPADTRFVSFDNTMTEFMRRRAIPGGSLAVIKDGRLVYARGYGYADRAAKLPVEPGSLFRIASITKPFTSAAIMTLVQSLSIHLDLDAAAFPMLGLKPLTGDAVDPRLWKITIRQLLHHTGGFDSAVSGDPMFMPTGIAIAAGKQPPADQTAIIRYMMGRPLDFDAGSREAYSNFGYCVLGRIIEKVTGKSYEEYVRETVLKPLGIRRMRLGRSRLAGRAPGEVRYYMPANTTTTSIFPKDRGAQVPWPYGGFNIEAMDSHGAWIASAVDLVRFAAGLDRPNGLLKRRALDLLYERPAPPVGLNPDGTPAAAYYACGWSVRPVGNRGRANYWHNGSLPGTWTLLVRRSDGLSWAALFNQRSEGSMPDDGEIDGALHRAANAITEWPQGDLFPQYDRP